MTYARQTWPVTAGGGELVELKASQLANLDKAVFDQDARITTLEATVADLLARVVVLETP